MVIEDLYIKKNWKCVFATFKVNRTNCTVHNKIQLEIKQKLNGHRKFKKKKIKDLNLEA